MATVQITRGADKKLDILLTGVMATEEIRIYFQSAGQVVDKYSTIPADVAGEYSAIASVTYDAGTNITTLRLNLPHTKTSDYQAVRLAVVAWVRKTDPEFPAGFVRIK
ncbi:hypothetical protein BVY04_00095, partial [bacterium M21]